MATFVADGGITLVYECRGAGSRVYSCHGGPANDHRYLAEDLEMLLDEHQLVFHDYRGSGLSENAPHSSYTIDQLADDLDHLRRELGDDAITVLGHSMGGYIALEYALRHSDHCEQLILVGTWPATVPRKMLPSTIRVLGWERSIKMMARALWWIVEFSWRHHSPEALRRGNSIWSTMQEGQPSIRNVEEERERRLGLPLDNDNVRPLQRQFLRWDLTDRLVDIPCPVLVLFGSLDAAAVAGAATFTRFIPDVRICQLPGIGHDPFFEAPDLARDAIESFLTR